MVGESAIGGPAGVVPQVQAVIERERELVSLEALLDDADRGLGRVVLLSGEPGIGKTSLLREIRRRATERHLTVLSARATELERSFGFGVVHQLLDPVMRSLDADQRRELMAGAAGLAEPLFEGRGAGAEAPDDPSYSVLHGLYWLVANLADRGPLLIAVDDAQWADRPSGRFIEFLVPRLEGLAVGLVVAVREQNEAPVLDALPSLAGQPSERIRPRRLSAGGVRSVVEAAVGKSTAEELSAAATRATGGNPFLVRELSDELARATASGGSLDSAAVGGLGPRSVSTAVLTRINRIDRATAITRAVAVLGDGAILPEVAALANTESEQAAQVADALSAVSVLEPGRPLAFAHPIVRSAVYEDIPAATRSALHAHAAQLAEERGASVQAVATHLLEVEPAGDSRAVETLLEAARAALRQGGAEPAIDLLRRALNEPPPPSRRAEVMHELGSALARVGAAEALDLLREAFALTSAPVARARVAWDLAEVLLFANKLAEAVELLEASLTGLAGVDAELAGRIEGMALLLGVTSLEAREIIAPRIRSAAAGLEEMPPAQSRCLMASLAAERSLWEMADADEAATLARRALADGRLLRDGTDASVALGATVALTFSGRYAEAEHALGVLIEEARRRGSLRGFAVASAHRSVCRFLRGALRGAEADARAFLDLSSEAAWALLHPAAAMVLAGVLQSRGDIEGALSALAPLAPFADFDDFGFVQMLHTIEAALQLECGGPEAALRAIDPCRRFEESMEAGAVGAATVIDWRSPAAQAHQILGNHAAALSTSGEQVRLARMFGAPRALGVALRILAGIEGGTSSIERLEESVAVLDGADAEAEHAHSLVDLGSALRRASQRRAAREPLSAGMDLAYRCGATALAERAREELVAAGARPRRLAVSGRDALTASERRAAEMAIEGLSNREIAQALFVTRRTIEGHLSNAFAKLEVSSREELAVAMAA